MINPGFVLLPLYLYPESGNWNPLFKVAKANPNTTFAVVVNPYDGPGAGSCPDSNYISVLSKLNSISNIKSLGYVHTADAYDCGSSGTDICVCSQPLSAVEANITTYEHWASGDCTSEDIHVDGIFFDEAPSNATCIDYMRKLVAFADDTLTNGNTALFNPGSSVNDEYWSIADYINVFEDTEKAYYAADIGALDGDGVYHAQTTMIIYKYTSDLATEKRDVNTILNSTHDAMAGLYITDLDSYNGFPTHWARFVKDVGAALS